jgi:hypothetical protein
MNRRSMLALAAGLLTAAAVPFAAQAATFTASGPFTHENLAIYFIHSERSSVEAPLTLHEALKDGVVRIYESGNVNEVLIENTGDADVFVQAGEIIKGGKQDRVLNASMIVPPRCGRLPAATYSVEEGRWGQRGIEDVTRFSTADALFPHRQAKLAMRAPATVQIASAELPALTPADPQRDIWLSITSLQESLTRSLGRPVNTTVSRSSLQLSLETERLKERQTEYVKGVGRLPQDETIVGYAFAVNGRLNSAEVFGSQALFAKLWPKLLRASATEAIAESGRLGDAVPSTEAVAAFLNDVHASVPRTRSLSASARHETRNSEHTLYMETQDDDGRSVHRTYLAR